MYLINLLNYFIIDNENIIRLYDILCIINYSIYKFLYKIIFNFLYFYLKWIALTFIKFIKNNLSIGYFYYSYYLKIFIISWFRYYNRRLIKIKRRRKLYMRFGFLKSYRFLFLLYFILLFIIIWKRRNLYKKTFVIYYYFLLYYTSLFISILLYSLLQLKLLSIFISLTCSFIFIVFSLK